MSTILIEPEPQNRYLAVTLSDQATPKQVLAIRQVANGYRQDVEAICQRLFATPRYEQLSKRNASLLLTCLHILGHATDEAFSYIEALRWFDQKQASTVTYALDFLRRKGMLVVIGSGGHREYRRERV